MSPPDERRLTYSDAGVDIGAGEKAVELIKAHVRTTFRPEVIGDVGGFGGLFALDWKRYREPLLVSSTDGVGTKSVIARLANRRDKIGIDCVAMSVDDIAAQGAEPLFFLDYISVGKLVPDEIDELVAGVADGCRQAALRPARRRDVGASRRDGAGRVRPRRLRGRCRRTGAHPPARTSAPAIASWGSRAPACAATATRSRARVLLDRAGRDLGTRPGPARTTRSPTSCSSRA